MRMTLTVTAIILFEDESQLPNGSYSEYNIGTTTATIHCNPKATMYDAWDALLREMMEKAQNQQLRIKLNLDMRLNSVRYKGRTIVGDAELKQPLAEIGYISGEPLQVNMTQTVTRDGPRCTIS